jgi:hypothetical protein
MKKAKKACFALGGVRMPVFSSVLAPKQELATCIR